MTMNPLDLAAAVKARWRVAAMIGGALFLLIAVAAFMQSRQYMATTSLMLDLSQTDPTDTTQNQARVEVDSILGTQTDIIRSAKVINAVAKEAGFIDALPADMPADARLQQAAARVRAGLLVTTGRQSNVLQIQYLDPDPQVAARVANLAAQIYMREQVELRASPARTSAKWFNEQTADVRRRYEDAQKRLSDFQRAHDIIGINRMDLEAEKLKNMSYQLTQAQAEAAAARGKAGAGSVSDIEGSLIVQNLQEQVAAQSAKVQELGKTLGPNHPTMAAASAQLSELQTKLGAARASQAGAVSANSVAASRREGDLKSNMASQEDRMIRMSDVQDQLMVMQRDVDAARQTYDTVRQRFNEAALKSQISQPNASLLDEAAVPLLPAKPNLLLWLVGGIALGLVGGIAAVVLIEIAQPRVRSAAGVARATEVEVITELLPAPARGGWLPKRQEAA
ncbi:exopolysaccharide biosynthesis protein [Sphingobium sp. PAMC28499]|uniref:GNVR domain-containing protein n=1 Tax=Sphingobium sp. PAMC28499 TaxID=2565554 RepID=UPI00109DC04E|nr:GNVR domain-containing protein [Sphingobium sp. PAMC28499]QCB38846.1 exopolysaccharide biosynthesis protein [Sphingobium sp. PAMC28499]